MKRDEMWGKIHDMQVEVEQNAFEHAMKDLRDGEVQDQFVQDLFPDMLVEEIELFVNQDEVQDAFTYMNELLNDFRQNVIESYEGMQREEREFRRDVL